jgi:sulfatase maturation enzyme AslB (radical SAM superfamily)
MAGSGDGEPTVFRLEHGSDTLFYAPGYLVVAERGVADEFADHPGDERWRETADHLARHALDAARTWRDLHEQPFAPVCLTLYLNGECNLRCRYCYAEPVRGAGPRLSEQAVTAAARLVARNCVERAQPFTVALHGGGEPTLHPDLLDGLLSCAERVAAGHDLPVFRYLATNGVMSARTAAWLARRIDLIGISCDGPPDIHNAHRPAWDGQPSSRSVERTAGILRDAGKPFHVRVTVTAASCSRQAEIAEYLCRDLGASQIHVEPVYRTGRAGGEPRLPAADFVTHFLAAEQVAHCYGVPYLTSGSRITEVHSSYCHILRQVLQLIPGDVATTCFAASDAQVARRQNLVIGCLDGDVFTLDGAVIGRMQATLAQTPDACQTCVNRFHCAGTCPEACALTGRESTDGFRCEVNRQLTLERLHRAATSLRSRVPGGVVGGRLGEIQERSSLA